MSTCKYKKYPTSAQGPDNGIIASNKKFPGLQLVAKGEVMFSDLNFYKILKVKRKVNEKCHDQKITIFYTRVTKKPNQDV